ncbi:MAG: hypothetical protein H0T46_01785 [Deltaproteobacteria bacterium]|nr:hypothetical protein [Deltaproteobacteria bacterium]
MTMNDEILDYAWCSPMTYLEIELVLVAWAVAARHHRADLVWAEVEGLAEQWLSYEAARAQA